MLQHVNLDVALAFFSMSPQVNLIVFFRELEGQAPTEKFY